MARLRKLHFACICHRQRQSAVLEYNSPPLEKPCKTRLFENSILCTAKMLGGEAQSKKSPKDFFDKLKGASFEAPLCVSGTASGLAVFVLFVEDLQAVDEDIRLQVELVPAVGDDQGADAAGEHGDSRPAPAATIMTEDAKTEKYTAGAPAVHT